MALDDHAALRAWAKATMLPLSAGARGVFADASAIARVIGDASLVALGEGAHGLTAPLEFRNRLFQFLVEYRGFSAIAIESGLVESRVVHEYARGGDGDLAAVMANGFSWGFDQFPQNRALVNWLRDHNASSRSPRKVNFYGFDLSGSPGLRTAHRGTETAFIEALNYLARVDHVAATTFRSRLAAFLPYFRFDYYHQIEGPNYDRLSLAERDALSAIVSDLIALLETQEAALTALSSRETYDWAHQAAVGARQVDKWMQQIPLGWEASLAQIALLDKASDLRDRAQADNIDWIVKREGIDGRALIFGHNAHLSNSPVNRVWWPCESTVRHSRQIEHRQETAGSHLKHRYGQRLVTIGHLVGHQKILSGSTEPARLEGLPASIDELLGDIDARSFFLDLRAAPAAVERLLELEFKLGPGVVLPGRFEGFMTVQVREAFDALIYLETADAP